MNTNTITRDQTRLLPQTIWRWEAAPPDLASLAKNFNPISLKEMDAVALLNRTDTKLVMPVGQLLVALAAVQRHYRMLVVNSKRLNHYHTLYFDTPDFKLYNLHVNGHADRYKVRSREYIDSGLSFLEVKHRTNKGRTIKERVRTERQVLQMTLEAENWLHGVFPYNAGGLEPKLWSAFTRLTLVSQQYCERMTLDVNLTLYATHKMVQLEGLAIAEVKMDACNQDSPFLAQMRAQRIRLSSFSKYCTGVAMLYNHVKKNALKPKLLWLEKMTREL
ncbi:MAG: polyphosphate polymerase domain-containing protein [Chloroflexota bacterium]